MEASLNVGPALGGALQRANGARYYKCALQVNPYAYVKRHSTQSAFENEDDYNDAMVAAAKAHGVEVVAVTDHYRVKTSEALIAAFEKHGIQAFPGFEAVTKDGVHVLCIFPRKAPLEQVDRRIGECGVAPEDGASPLGNHDLEHLLGRARDWGAVMIAAHVCSDGGMLRVLKGLPRIRAWRSEHLIAVSLPGPVADAPQDMRQILDGTNAEHKRSHPIAVVNSQDASRPEDFEKKGTSCWIKMSEPSLDGLKQAFLDPESRVRLASDEVLSKHVELVAMSWEGGFLDGLQIHWNENLNVLVGGRGTGKSTIIESVRSILGRDALGERAQEAHRSLVKSVLRAGTKVSLLVRSYEPSPRDYVIERTIPNPPVVKDTNGVVLRLTPADVLPHVDIFGQHEVSELSRDPQKLTGLLARFMREDADHEGRRDELSRKLVASREALKLVEGNLVAIEARLAKLPSLVETSQRFQETGIEAKFNDTMRLIPEGRVFAVANEKLAPARDLAKSLRKGATIDTSFSRAENVKDSPRVSTVGLVEPPLLATQNAISEAATSIEAAIRTAEQTIAAAKERWTEESKPVKEEYEQKLRELQKGPVDADAFVQLRKQIEELKPLEADRTSLVADIALKDDDRRQVLDQWGELRRQRFEALQRAAKKVNRELQGTVKVTVTFEGDRSPLANLLKEKIGGRLKESIDRLLTVESLSLRELSGACRAGAEALQDKYSISATQADLICKASQDLFREIEELELEPTTKVELNVGTKDAPHWKTLDELSTGQKATAILLVLLLESDTPLIIDQPEDDLDNRFISDDIVPKMRGEKRRRQFIFSSHNANVPVLGDAELIVGLTADGRERGSVTADVLGAIDKEEVATLIKALLEGGEAAFEMRRRKYRF